MNLDVHQENDMYSEQNRTLPVTAGWTAEFIFRYQVSMSGDGWGLVLHGPEGLKIDRFKDFIWLCGTASEEWSDEEFMGLLDLSDDEHFLTIKTQFDGKWVAALSTGAMLRIQVDDLDPWVEDPDANA